MRLLFHFSCQHAPSALLTFSLAFAMIIKQDMMQGKHKRGVAQSVAPCFG